MVVLWIFFDFTNLDVLKANKETGVAFIKFRFSLNTDSTSEIITQALE